MFIKKNILSLPFTFLISTLMLPFLILVVIVFAILAVVKPSEIVSRWHHHFDEFQFSSEEFYQVLSEGIKRRELPNVLVGTANYFEGSVLSRRRAYFKVSNSEYIFDICAASYGKNFFVSWWLKESKSLMAILIARWFPIASEKTYYQMDTTSMFRESIHRVVLEAIDVMTKEKGVRGLSELERQVVTNPKYMFKG